MKSTPVLLAISFSVLTLFSGCQADVQVTDGALPVEVLPVVTPYLGQWNIVEHYLFEKSFKGQLRIEMNGNRPVLTTTADVVGEDCGSKIGELESFSYDADDQGNPKDAIANFKLNPGKCRISGKVLSVQLGAGLFGGFGISYLQGYQKLNDKSGTLKPVYNSWTIERPETALK